MIREGLSVNIFSSLGILRLVVCLLFCTVAFVGNASSQDILTVGSGTSQTPGVSRMSTTASLAYMGGSRGLRAGYTGLVLPGACVSSYFVYDLEGALASASILLMDSRALSFKLKGSYLFAADVPADQEITWLVFPPGARSWNWAKSSFFKLEGEFTAPMDDSFFVIGGMRWESLSTTFGDPDPSYLYTISAMESGLGINIYQPYLGVAVQRRIGPYGASLKLIGLPLMLGFLEHFNTCNNNNVPFAHVGSQAIRNGYFMEVSAEVNALSVSGMDLGFFIGWELYRGTCVMNLERRDMGPPQTVTAADVDFLYNRSSVTVGAQASVPLRFPF